jgi:hypothetical protein
MTKGREISAEKLSDVLELIRKRQQSGMLSVEHYQGGILEEGELYFQDGQIIYAKTGNLSGQEALNSFLRWRQVLFMFQANARPPQPVNAPTDTSHNKAAVISNTQATLPEKASNTGNLPVTPPTIPQFNSRNAPAMRKNTGTPGNPSPNDAPPHTIALTREWIIPHRLETGQNVLSLPLSRPQRSLILLVDGQRSISDLARCTRKSLQEIEQQLRELQQQGLVAL